MLSTLLYKRSIAIGSIQSVSLFSTSAFALKEAIATKAKSTKSTTTKASDKKETKTTKPKKLTFNELKKADKPKRAVSSYNIFYKENLDKFYDPNSGMKVADGMAEAAEAWKSLSESEKLEYQKKAEPFKKAYDIAVKEWEAKYKRPLTGYNKFIKYKMSTIEFVSVEANKTVFADLAKEWATLTAEEKADWKKKEI